MLILTLAVLCLAGLAKASKVDTTKDASPFVANPEYWIRKDTYLADSSCAERRNNIYKLIKLI